MDNNRYSKYTHLHMLVATTNNCRLDDLPAIIAFNNKMNNMFSNKSSSIKNGGMEKEKRGNGNERKSCKLDVTSILWI